MSYFPVRFFLKLPLLILVPYSFLFCIPVFSQDGVVVSNPGINSFVLPRPDKLPSQLNLEGEPEWRYQPQVDSQMDSIGGEVTTPGLLQVISSMDGDLPPISGSGDMNDLLAELLKELTQKHDRKMNPPFNETELDPKQPALLVFDAANDGRQIVLTIGEQGHLNATELVDEKTEIKAITEWEDLGVVWRDNKNNFYTTSAERTIESLDNDFGVLAYLNAFGVRTLYYRTQADGTRVYVYKALDGKIYEVTAEDIKRSQQRTYEYEMAKVSGDGLAAGGRINYGGEWVQIRPAGPERPEIDKGILDQEIEARQAPRGPKSPKSPKSPGNHPYQRPGSVEHSPGSNKASAPKEGESGSEQSQQNFVEMQAGSPTLNYGYDDKGKPTVKEWAPEIKVAYGYEDKGNLTIKGWTHELKVAPDGSFAAGIIKGKVVIYVPAQSDNEEGKISSLDIKATSLSLSKDGLCMATEDGGEVKLWNRGKEVNQWALSDALDTSEGTNEMVKAMKFSPGGDYHIVTRDSGSVALTNLKGRNNLCLKQVQQLTFDEQDRRMVVVHKESESRSGKVEVWQMSPEKNKLLYQQGDRFECDIQRVHLSPDAKMIVFLSESQYWVGKVKNSARIDVEHLAIWGYGRMMDVYLDNNSAITIQYLQRIVTLTHIKKMAEDYADFDVVDFTLTENDDRAIANAFYIPNSDSIAVIFSDGSMSMWQNAAKGVLPRKKAVVPNFGRILYYNGPENCFLVEDSDGRVIVRQWSKQ